MWMITPPQIDRVAIASVPSAMPATMDPTHSSAGLPKWIVQYYGTIISLLLAEEQLRR